jgi:hypothetical protein
MFARKVHNLRHFGFRDFVGVDSALSDSVVVNMQHDSRGCLAILVEEALEHVNHELHGCVVVIEQQNTVKVWPLGLRLRFGDDGGAWAALITLALAVIVGQARATTGVLIGTLLPQR